MYIHHKLNNLLKEVAFREYVAALDVICIVQAPHVGRVSRTRTKHT
jgi:hypothetical protein